MTQKSTDFSAISSLVLDGVIAATEIVEAMHSTISSYSWPIGVAKHKYANGVAGLVYWGIREAGALAGRGVEKLHFRPKPIITQPQSTPSREATLAILNGVLGDHLAARNNPLAIPMQWRRDGQAWDKQALAAAIAEANGRVAIMVHGSCMNDLQWLHKGHNHADQLIDDLGLLPIYLHYNSGRHISENGREFAALLETLNSLAEQPLEIFVVAHSMGGLVTRSACHYAQMAGHDWFNQLRKIVFLSTPHHGAPLERGGNWIDTLLEISPYSAPLARLGKIRSSGVTDLRYGNVIDDDWQGRDRFLMVGDQRTPVPLPQGVECYTVAAIKSSKMTMLSDELIGDNLVPLSSALGRHRKPEMSLDFAQENMWIGREMNHKDVLCRPEVYSVIKQWLSG